MDLTCAIIVPLVCYTANDMTEEKHEQVEDYLTDQVEIAHNLITRLRQLLTMEKTDAVMDRSLNRTRFFKMDDDHRK